MDEEQLQIRTSALIAQAMSRIVAELGPRALPLHRENYIATAAMIASEEFGPNFDFRMTVDLEGKPHIFIEKYRGRS
jgi:hypothetical protein